MAKNKQKTSDKKMPKQHSNQKAIAGKNALRSTLVAVLVIVLTVAILLGVIAIFFNSIAAKPNLQFINSGRIEHTIGATALIVRDETIVEAHAEGDLVTKATEGSRVSKTQNLALIVPQNMSSVVSNLRNTQSQISEVQQEVIAAGKAPGATQIFKNVDEDIKPIIDLLRVDSMNGNLSDLSSFESSISVLVDKREKELAKIEFEDERLTLLRSDAASYENQLSKSSAIVNAPVPGIVSYKLDGQEKKLSFDYLLTADANEIDGVIDNSVGVITSDMKITKGENVARISQNEEQYIAVVLSGKDVNAADFKLESEHNINIASEGVAIDNCRVVRSTPCDDGILVVFSTTKHVESLLDLRTVNIEIVITSTTGLRVQVGCLVNPDYERGIASIYINDKGFVTEVGVLIEDYDREFAIIKPLDNGNTPSTKTVIITNPGVTSPGEKVG